MPYCSTTYQPNHNSPITVLSFGGGQDSAAILALYLDSPSFRGLFARGRLMVVFSDTGAEKPETYSYLHYVQGLCKHRNIEFYWLRPEMGFHSRTWHSLYAQMERNHNIMSVAMPKSCTDKLKCVPIYSFLAHYASWYMDVVSPDKSKLHFPKSNIQPSDEDFVRKLKEVYARDARNKRSFYKYQERFGRLNIILGIAYGEDRIKDKMPHKYQQRCLQRIYPLWELSFDRKACQDYIKAQGYVLPVPSNCEICPFMNLPELLYLYRFRPERFAYMLRAEVLKKQKDRRRNVKRSLGFFGSKSVFQKLVEAQEKYGSWSDEELKEYTMSHGHCVKSKY